MKLKFFLKSYFDLASLGGQVRLLWFYGTNYIHWEEIEDIYGNVPNASNNDRFRSVNDIESLNWFLQREQSLMRLKSQGRKENIKRNDSFNLPRVAYDHVCSDIIENSNPSFINKLSLLVTLT
ncbi:hypothetical protein L1887_10500 [Cichorium endivia]|nr:hypothetical protein L1887_10500 [Cichorium endivia]